MKISILFLSYLIVIALEDTAAVGYQTPVPYQVSIELNSNFACTGAVISVHWILTVASCIYNTETRDVIVRADSAIPLWRGLAYTVRQSTTHPQYDQNNFLQVNIALLKLYTRMKFNRWVRPVTMWPRSPQPDSEGWTTGWGCSKYYRSKQNQPYVKTRIHLLNSKYCLTNDSVGLLCVSSLGDSSNGKCLGGYGTLLTVQKRLAGFYLLSLHKGFSLFVDVSAHIPWIKYAAFESMYY